ncbi:MAG TPA: divalent-cation tolerance protein CutA [Burkholderiales bacterium]|nr:divalent-cation tolerance protein CutA [Burkholderiales bacterium]
MSMPCLMLTTLPDHESALDFARILVKGRLAACIQIGARVDSIYRWEGGIEETTEVPVMIKTLTYRVEEIKSMINVFHPYDVPEILILNAEASAAYLEWMHMELGDA